MKVGQVFSDLCDQYRKMSSHDETSTEKEKLRMHFPVYDSHSKALKSIERRSSYKTYEDTTSTQIAQRNSCLHQRPTKWSGRPSHGKCKWAFRYTLKPQYNDSEGTKNFVLYCRGFVIEGVVITRFQCTLYCIVHRYPDALGKRGFRKVGGREIPMG
jgi:hypothetical protein